jgi:hypothetical protein
MSETAIPEKQEVRTGGDIGCHVDDGVTVVHNEVLRQGARLASHLDIVACQCLISLYLFNL